MLEPQQAMSVQEIVDWAVYAEQTEYGYILRSDHLLPIWDSKERDSPARMLVKPRSSGSKNK